MQARRRISMNKKEKEGYLALVMAQNGCLTEKNNKLRNAYGIAHMKIEDLEKDKKKLLVRIMKLEEDNMMLRETWQEDTIKTCKEAGKWMHETFEANAKVRDLKAKLESAEFYREWSESYNGLHEMVYDKFAKENMELKNALSFYAQDRVWEGVEMFCIYSWPTVAFDIGSVARIGLGMSEEEDRKIKDRLVKNQQGYSICEDALKRIESLKWAINTAIGHFKTHVETGCTVWDEKTTELVIDCLETVLKEGEDKKEEKGDKNE